MNVGFFGRTRHQFGEQNQSLMLKMSGMAGFSRMREVPRIGALFFVCAKGVRPASTFGLQLDAKAEDWGGLLSVSL